MKGPLAVIFICSAMLASLFAGHSAHDHAMMTRSEPVVIMSGGTVNVTVSNFSFSPQNVSIPAGTTVVWTNNSGFHSTTSDTNIWNRTAASAPWTFSLQFNDVGQFPYYCTVHGAPGGLGMSGTITVTAPPITVTVVSRVNGHLLIDGLTAPGATLTVEAAPDPVATDFRTLGSTTADSTGAFHFDDGDTAQTTRFYRVEFP